MSRKKNKPKELSPEEQVFLHLALKGEDDIPEAISDDEQNDTIHDEYIVSPLEYVRRYLRRAAGTVYSFFELRIPSFVFNEFLFEETDLNRAWQLNTITSDTDEPETENVRLEFIRFTGTHIETRECMMNELSEDDWKIIGEIAKHCRLELQIRNEETDTNDEDVEDEYDVPFSVIDDVPVYSAKEYVEESHFIFSNKARNMYEDIAELIGNELIHSDSNFGHVIPVEPVYGVFKSADGHHPEMYELIAVSKLKDTEQMVALGHPYRLRNSRQRRTEEVFPLELCPLGSSAAILQRLEKYYQEEEEDDTEDIG